MEGVPDAVLGLSRASEANREVVLPPPVLVSHRECRDEGRREEAHTHQARLWRLATRGCTWAAPVVT